ncbi:uncharacterized protein DSM5745_01128 [Aspergillus mulundensis]|uniref:Uncharacterized protein n=1 Tax=Aspergillus mulundensis TaxID=1810919 RepID=A0A3D8T5G2_9EURO|nr:hypothetical protein DSM5745_01128 [Aspergillus mulundensis]RDW93806.1 hypothetical protein DSM5745_01128 [Aspergillus mulundensis]
MTCALKCRFSRSCGIWLDGEEACNHDAYWYCGAGRNTLPLITLKASLEPKASDLMEHLIENARRVVSVINPNVSREMRRHVLDVEAQARHYNLDGKATRKHDVYAKYRGWYFYEENVTPDEIVGHWKWDDLAKNECWYEDVIMPAFKKHDEEYRARIRGQTEARKANEGRTLLERRRWRTKTATDEVAMKPASERQAKKEKRASKQQKQSSENQAADKQETASESDEDAVAVEKEAALTEYKKARPTFCAAVGKVLRSIGGIFIWKKDSTTEPIMVGEMEKTG